MSSMNFAKPIFDLKEIMQANARGICKREWQ